MAKQNSESSSDSASAAGATCTEAVIPDVVIFSADTMTDESRPASTTVSGDIGGQAAGVAVPSKVEVDERWKLCSFGALSAMPVNSRSLPQLPFVAATVPDAQTDFELDPMSRRSLSSLQSAASRTWRGRCAAGGLHPGRSLSSVAAVETPLTSSASSAATTAGGGVGSDAPGSFDDEEPAPQPPVDRSLPHADRHVDGYRTPPLYDLTPAHMRSAAAAAPATDDVHQTARGSVDEEDDVNRDRRLQRIQQQRRQRQFRRRQHRVSTGHPSSNSL